jgi:hypothetical protein
VITTLKFDRKPKMMRINPAATRGSALLINGFSARLRELFFSIAIFIKIYESAR